jgi:hypothetical protein
VDFNTITKTVITRYSTNEISNHKMSIIIVQPAFSCTFEYKDVRHQPQLVGGSYEEEQKVDGLYARIGTVATSPRVTYLQHHNLQHSMS